MGAASVAATLPLAACNRPEQAQAAAQIGNGKMKLSFRPYELQLRHTFTVAGNSRNTTLSFLIPPKGINCCLDGVRLSPDVWQSGICIVKPSQSSL